MAALVDEPIDFEERLGARALLWRFVRDSLPLPVESLQNSWHPAFKNAVTELFEQFAKEGVSTPANLNLRLANRALPDGPALSAPGSLRHTTVHKAKGESLDGVLYLATKAHLNAMLDGVATEVGRIGYVAVTRARYLLWVGVPAAALKKLRPRLVEIGLTESPSVNEITTAKVRSRMRRKL